MEDDFIKKLNEAEKRDIIKIKNLLGKGACSEVLHAKYDKKDVAIKLFKRKNKEAMLLYKNELDAFKLLSQNNYAQFIVCLYDTLSTQRNLRLIMELGKMTLRRKISIMYKKFDIFEATIIIEQIIKAVRFMHDLKIAHRDLKPENMLFFQNNNIKICDFGFAKPANNINRPLRTICGTPPYMAPELFRLRKNEPYNGLLIDVWAMGVIFFEILHNRLPFQSTTLIGLKRSISMNKYYFRPLPQIHKTLINQCLTKSIYKRPYCNELIIPVKKLS